MQKLLTIDVSHGTMHDGPGMRTTVFVKGCPLHCLWCQNPESISRKNEVWWDKAKCIGCKSCIAVCPNHALSTGEKGIFFDREKCAVCGDCADICPTEAMSRQAQEYDMDTLIKEVLKDRIYYKQFGGGITCSGGEPLLQYEFVAEFFRRMHKEGITTALDTCGCVPVDNLKAVLPYTNHILYDIKLINSDAHQRFTGAPNERILENLLYAAQYVRSADHPMEIWIRTPLIPTATATVENIFAIGAFIRNNLMDVVTRWEMCSFNGVCVSKYDKLGTKWAFDGIGAMCQRDIAPLKKAALSCVPENKVIVTGMIRSS